MRKVRTKEGSERREGGGQDGGKEWSGEGH